MNKPHKYAEVIKAWADGKAIQWKRANDKFWYDLHEFMYPEFNHPKIIWRIKPEIISGKFRVGFFKGIPGYSKYEINTIYGEERIQQEYHNDNLICWLTDIVEYNVELSENIQFDEMKPIKKQNPFVNIPNINSENQPVE